MFCVVPCFLATRASLLSKPIQKTRFRLAKFTFLPPKFVQEHDLDLQDVDFDLQPEANFSTPLTKTADFDLGHPFGIYSIELEVENRILGGVAWESGWGWQG